MPETSIIVRTLNEERHLANLLRALEEQEYKDFEVIVVDSGSTDRTLEIAEQFKHKIIKIEKRDFTFGYSLNVGCNESVGKYLVFVSAHVLPVDKQWLSNLIMLLKNENVAMVYGKQMGNHLSKFSERVDFARLFNDSSRNSRVPINYANNANSAVKRSLWSERRFDEYLFGLEDIEWARHMAQKGFSIAYEPKASVYHIHEERWSQVFNRYRREAIAAVRMGLKQPPQAKLSIFWMCLHVILDLIYSFPNYTDARLKSILKFRYYQWKGSNLGWVQGKGINFQNEKEHYFHPEENQSVIIHDKRRAQVKEMQMPEMKPGDILIKVDYVGVCRTDIEVFEGTLGYYRDGVAKHPIVPGHEFSGTIVKIGSNNRFQERFKVGERVVGECILSRGKDSDRREVGVINYNGAYSQYIVMPGDAVHHIPTSVDSKTAVLTEPLAVVLRALRRVESRLKKDSRIAVIGAGQIGNLCAQVLVFRGYTVDLFDSDARRLDMLNERVQETHMTLEKLNEFDVLIEATGSVLVLSKVLKESSVDSTILLLGFPYGNMEYNFEDIVGNEKVVLGSVGAETEDFHNALNLLSSLHMTPFTQMVMPLEEYEKAWDIHKSLKHLKILLQP